MVWTSNLEQLRCFALSGAHRGRAAPGRLLFLMVGVFRLPTPLLRQWLMLHSVLWRGCEFLVALATSMRLRRFSYSRVVLRGLALSDVRGLCVLDAVVVAAVGDCYIVMVKVMVWTSNLGQLRCLALSGAHRGRAAPGRLICPDGRGLSTPDAAASAVVYGSLSDAWRGSYVVHHGRCRRVVERNGVRSRRFVARRHHTISFAPSQCSRGAHCPGMAKHYVVAAVGDVNAPAHLTFFSFASGLPESEQSALCLRLSVQFSASCGLLCAARRIDTHRK